VTGPVNDELHRTAMELLAARTQREVAQTAVRTVAHFYSADHSEVLQRAGDGLESRARITFGRTDDGPPAGLAVPEPMLERVQDTGMTGLIDDLTAVLGDEKTEVLYRSLLCVPIDDHGLLVAANREPGVFRGESVTRMERLAELVAAAFDRVDGGNSETSRHQAVAKVLSHDLQNALAVANGRLELALDGDTEQLEAVAAAHDRLFEMTDDLVTLLRTGDSVDSIEPVDLESAARRAWRTVDTAEAELVLGTAPEIMADTSSLSQLLENLFRNAVEHGGEEAVVEVGALEGAAGFYVADDGPGIDPEARKTVFELGYSTGERSSGYGLAIVERIAEAHGWAVTAERAAGGGARIEVRGVTPAGATTNCPEGASPEKRP
jgi:signal transduction histidine kinase